MQVGKKDTRNDPNPQPSTIRLEDRYLRSCSVPDDCFRAPGYTPPSRLRTWAMIASLSHGTGEHVTTSVTETSPAIVNIRGLSLLTGAIQEGCYQEENLFSEDQ